MSEMLPPFPPDPPPPPPPAPPAPPALVLPWEAPSAGLRGLFATAGRFILHPVEAYASMSLTVDLVRPIAYYVAFVLVGSILGQIWNFVFFESIVSVARNFMPPNMSDQFMPLFQRPGALQIVLGLVVSPLLMLIVLFVWTGLVHGALVLLGGAGSGFAATLRVVCYARTSDVASVVPMLGGLIGFVWRRILEVVGLSTAHRTEPWKAVVAILLPIILCCGCLTVGVFAFGAVIGRALQQAQ